MAGYEVSCTLHITQQRLTVRTKVLLSVNHSPVARRVLPRDTLYSCSQRKRPGTEHLLCHGGAKGTSLIRFLVGRDPFNRIPLECWNIIWRKVPTGRCSAVQQRRWNTQQYQDWQAVHCCLQETMAMTTGCDFIVYVARKTWITQLRWTMTNSTTYYVDVVMSTRHKTGNVRTA